MYNWYSYTKIVDGHPWSPLDHALFHEMTIENQIIVIEWITRNMTPKKTPLRGYNSYYLKHLLEYDTHIYLTNNQFKDAMLTLGFKPARPNTLNWEFCISKKSFCFTNPNGKYCGGVKR